MATRQPEGCRSCGASVVWLTTTKGTRMIVNAETVGPDDTVFDPLVHRAHWADCPHKADWRKNKR
jgi:hypothetical protein